MKPMHTCVMRRRSKLHFTPGECEKKKKKTLTEKARFNESISLYLTVSLVFLVTAKQKMKSKMFVFFNIRST